MRPFFLDEVCQQEAGGYRQGPIAKFQPVLLSVIIPSFNRCELLQKAVASVFASAGEGAVEVVVVDDGSTDGTVDYLRAQRQLKWQQQANAGPAAARNRGARMATGDYFAFLDSDDLWMPWTYRCYHAAIERSGAAFIAGKPRLFSDEAELSEAMDEPMQCRRFADYLASGDEWRWWGCSSFVIQRAAFFAAGGFHEERMNAEDADFALRMATADGFAQITAPVTFGYREHAVSEMKNASLNLKGTRHLLEAQLAGKYPGGVGRRREQWRIVSRHLRPVAVAGVASSNAEERTLAWRIYRATLVYHVRSLRWKFVLGFLWKAMRG